MSSKMTKELWPYMRTEARVYVKGREVFIAREWSGSRNPWVRQHKFYHNVTEASLGRLRRLYSVRYYEYAPDHFEKFRTFYQKQAA